MNDGVAAFGAEVQRTGTGLMTAEAEERQRQADELSRRRQERAETARRAQAMEVQAGILNDVDAITTGFADRIASGEVHKDVAYGDWTKEVSKLVPKRLAEIQDEGMRELAKASMDSQLGRAGGIIRGAVDKRNQSDVRSGLHEYLVGMSKHSKVDLAYSLRNGALAIDGMGAAAGYTPAQIQELRTSFIEETTESSWTDFMVNNQFDKTALIFGQENIEQDENLSLARKSDLKMRYQQAIDRADRALEAEQRRADAAQAEKDARLASDLEIGVKRGQYGYKEIEDLYNMGAISPSFRAGLTTWLDHERTMQGERARRQTESIKRVGGAIQGLQYLDPRSESDRKDVDVYFDQNLVPTLKDKPRFEQMQAIADFSARVGIVPGTVRSQIRGALRAGQPGARIEAADLLDRIKSQNPATLNDFSAEDIAYGNLMSNYTRAGVSPEQAVQLVDSAMKLSDGEKKAREDRYLVEKAADSNSKFLKSEFTGRWTGPGPAQVPDALAGEFQSLVHAEFLRTGDLEVAQQSARDQLKRVWGVTKANGYTQWMKYAPGIFYPVRGQSDEWIGEQLNAEMSKNALKDPDTTYVLAADSITAREQHPTYAIFAKKDGALWPVMGKDGMPTRFRPDFPTSPEGKRRATDKVEMASRRYMMASTRFDDLSNRYMAKLGDPATPAEELKELQWSVELAKSETDALHKWLVKLRQKADLPEEIERNRPKATNIERTRPATVRVWDGERYKLLSTDIDGKRVSEQEAIDLWKAGKNDPVGSFETADQADAYAKSRGRALENLRIQQQGIETPVPADAGLQF